MVDLGPYKAFCINDPGQVVAAAGPARLQCKPTFPVAGPAAWVDIGSLGGNETHPMG